MTKLNREKLYSHYKNLAENYTAEPERDTGLFATVEVRRNAKAHVDAILKQHPELEPKKIEVKVEVKTKVDLPDSEVETTSTDFSKLTKAELKVTLDKTGISYSDTATKAELIELFGEL